MGVDLGCVLSGTRAIEAGEVVEVGGGGSGGGRGG